LYHSAGGKAIAATLAVTNPQQPLGDPEIGYFSLFWELESSFGGFIVVDGADGLFGATGCPMSYLIPWVSTVIPGEFSMNSS
jgi:hypothetical protein